MFDLKRLKNQVFLLLSCVNSCLQTKKNHFTVSRFGGVNLRKA